MEDEAPAGLWMQEFTATGWSRWLPAQCTELMFDALHPSRPGRRWGRIDWDADGPEQAAIFGEWPDDGFEEDERERWTRITRATGQARPDTWQGIAEILEMLGLLQTRPGGGHQIGAWYAPVAMPLPGEVLPLSADEITREDAFRFADAMRGPAKVLNDVLESHGWETETSLAELIEATGLDPETVRQALAFTVWHPDPPLDLERIDPTTPIRLFTQIHEDNLVTLQPPTTWTITQVATRWNCPLRVARRSFERLDPAVYTIDPPVDQADDHTAITIDYRRA